MSPSATVQKALDSSKVVIFSKTYCPYCRSAKELFDKLGQKYAHVELDAMGSLSCLVNH